MKRPTALVAIVFVGLLAAAMLACETQTAAPTDTATPAAAGGEATQAPAGAAETPASTPGATLPPAITPTPPSPTSGTPTPAAAPADTPAAESALSGLSWRKDGLTVYEPDALEALQHIQREHPAAAEVVLSYPWVADSITWVEWRTLSSLQSISENNAALLQRLVAFPWLANGIDSTFEELAVDYLVHINLEDPSLATRLAGFQWIADGINEEEMFALSHIWQINAEDASLAQQVVAFPWVADGVTDAERHRLGRILSDAAPAATTTPTPVPAATPTPTPVPAATPTPTPTPAARPSPTPATSPRQKPIQSPFAWARDGLTDIEREALGFLQDIERHYPRAYQVVLDSGWISDGITEPERRNLCSIITAGDSEHAHDIALGKRVTKNECHASWAAPATESAIFDFPWEKDGLTWEEHNALQFLHTIEQEHPEIAHAILIRFQWLADGIIRGERFVTNGVMHLARRDPSLALLYMDLPWLADGISDDDYDMYGKVLSLTWLFAEDDLSLATRLVSFPWIADGINDREHDALDSVEKLILGSLSQQTRGEPRDTTIARRLFDFPWFVDGIEGYEGAPILFLSVFRDFLGELKEEDLNAILDSLLFEAPFTHAKANSLGAVGFLLMDGRWEQVISQPWYQDGVTDADFVRITLITTGNEEDFQRLLQGDYLESETYSLPLAGEVTAYVISKDPYEQEALFEALGAGMKAIEDIIDAPWPDPYPVVRLFSESSAPSGYSLPTGRYRVARLRLGHGNRIP